MINIFPPDDFGNWQVWLDCDAGSERDGRCIGVGKSAGEAVYEAIVELRRHIDVLECAPVSKWTTSDLKIHDKREAGN